MNLDEQGSVPATRRLSRVALAAAGTLVLASLVAGAALAAKGDTLLVSRQSQSAGDAGATARSYAAAVSKSGRYVVFTTEATNLGGTLQTGSGEANVYVYDARDHVVELVSRQSEAAGGLGGDGDSRVDAISASGRFVAFRTAAANLGGPINAGENIYVYDRDQGRVQLISRKSKAKGGKGANQDSDNPSISGSGRYVAYHTHATNLGGPIDGEGEVNVYVYDRKHRETTLVSRRSLAANGNGGNSNSFDPKIATGAPVVAFASQATNLGGPTKPGASANVYVHDWKAGETQLVSRRSQSSNGQGANSGASQPDVSASGRHVAYYTDATNLGGPIQTPMGGYNVYRYDRKTQKTLLVSRRSQSEDGEGADASSTSLAISGSGRYLAYATQATNLGGPIDASVNVYAYDTRLQETSLASRESGDGPGADGYSSEPDISGSGRFIVFGTAADNLGGPVYTGGIPHPTSIYRFDLLGP